MHLNLPMAIEMHPERGQDVAHLAFIGIVWVKWWDLDGWEILECDSILGGHHWQLIDVNVPFDSSLAPTSHLSGVHRVAIGTSNSLCGDS